MHFFEHNVGEFATITRFMTPTEVGIYVILRDEYLYNGVPLVYDRITSMFPVEYEGALKRVLNRCFVEKDGVFTCAAFDEMLEKYAAQAEKNRRNVQKRWEKARKTCKTDTTEYESNTTGTDSNTKTYLTKNQEPRTKNQIKEIEKKSSLEKPESVDDETFNDWVAFKKQVSKAKPSQRMVDAMVREAGKAGISTKQAMITQMEQGWQGFKAEYVNKNGRNTQPMFDDFSNPDMTGLTRNEDGSYSF